MYCSIVINHNEKWQDFTRLVYKKILKCNFIHVRVQPNPHYLIACMEKYLFLTNKYLQINILFFIESRATITE